MAPEITPDDCPCGSRQPYSTCCEPCHQGKPASSPEALMRSRYSAFVLNLTDYLKATWHTSTRPQDLDLTEAPKWVSLQVLSSDEGEHEGTVHFRALYRAGGGWGYLEENSRFVRDDERWYYVPGDTREGTLKPGRNESCPCGSGRKYKACCL